MVGTELHPHPVMLGHHVLSAGLSTLPELEPRRCTSNPFNPAGRSDDAILFLDGSFHFNRAMPFPDLQGLGVFEDRSTA